MKKIYLKIITVSMLNMLLAHAAHASFCRVADGDFRCANTESNMCLKFGFYNGFSADGSGKKMAVSFFDTVVDHSTSYWEGLQFHPAGGGAVMCVLYRDERPFSQLQKFEVKVYVNNIEIPSCYIDYNAQQINSEPGHYIDVQYNSITNETVCVPS